MGSSAAAAQEYWGYLINPDKSPAPLFEQLLLGIANYINKHIAPWDIQCLTPTKLAAFYRLVGGNHDNLFLETPPASLSYIYKSLGCFHSLQPDKDPFSPPSIPALTPQGFVRWQTVQLLLGPEEHVPYLQEAVKRFEIKNPGEGGPFPRILPADALPRRPDQEMCQWHETVSDELRQECEKQEFQKDPRTVYDVESLTDSSVDEHSIVDAADYFNRGSNQGRRHSPHSSSHSSRSPRRAHELPKIIPISPVARRPQIWPDSRSSSYRRRSLGDPDSPWPRDGPTPTNNFHQRSPQTARPRTPSLSDATDDSSFTASEASVSPEPRAREQKSRPSIDEYGRRRSSSIPYTSQTYPRHSKPPPSQSHTLSPPFFAGQVPAAQLGYSRPQFQHIPAPEGRGMRWRGDNVYARPIDVRNQPGGRRNLVFVDNDDRRFYDDRMRRRSMEHAMSSGGSKRYPQEETGWR